MLMIAKKRYFVMNIDRFNPVAIRKTFKFLIDEFGYSVIRDEELFHDQRRYGFIIEYVGNGRRVHLSHDYKEEFFDFVIIQGLNTRYPNDYDQKNIVSFWKLFKSFEPSLALKALQPDGQTCAEAASINAQLLRKYASKILQGKEWI
jgi:hypothetical protein